MSIIALGSKFQTESNEAILTLGNSERFSTGQFLAETLVKLGAFDDVFVLTVNDSNTSAGRRALRSGLKSRVGVGHSIGTKYMLDVLEDTGATGLQLVAFNPPEPMSRLKQVWRASTKVANEPKNFISEPGAEYTGNKAALEALGEMARGLPTTLHTMSAIAHGFSGTERMIAAAEDWVFPAGMAMIHAEKDAFGFAQMADLKSVAARGITAVMMQNRWHNEILYAPHSMIGDLTPTIFPEK